MSIWSSTKNSGLNHHLPHNPHHINDSVHSAQNRSLPPACLTHTRDSAAKPNARKQAICDTFGFAVRAWRISRIGRVVMDAEHRVRACPELPPVMQ
eukprot:15370-Rhodomonas_salina.6